MRLLADRFAETFGKPVIVENVTGAAEIIAADRTAKATPDGYTIGMLNAASVTVNSNLNSKSLYDPVKDLAPVIQVYGYPELLVVNNQVPVKNVEELVALARAAPGKLTFGHSGVDTANYFSGELFKSLAQIDVQQVPFRGSPQILTDLMGGRISMSFTPEASLSLIQEGKIRAVSVTSLKRAPFVADLPTMDKSGFRGFDVTAWFGLFVPARTPASVIEKLNRETTEIIALPEVRRRLYDVIRYRLETPRRSLRR